MVGYLPQPMIEIMGPNVPASNSKDWNGNKSNVIINVFVIFVMMSW